MQAIQVWFDNITPCQYPPGNGDAASPQELFDYLTGNADLNGDGSIDSADAQTSCVLAAREFLLKLPQAAFQRGDDCIRDGFGEPIRYSQFGGIGGQDVNTDLPTVWKKKKDGNGEDDGDGWSLLNKKNFTPMGGL